MKINEVFYTLQGEGPRTGIPSVFIRLAGCNLRCTFCDTKYTWLFSNKTLTTMKRILPDVAQIELGDTVYRKSQEIRHLSVEEIISQISQYPAKNIVITGGEPLLQKNELIRLLSEDFFKDKFVEIETNGTIEPFDNISINIHYNVSPKLKNSFNPIERRYKVEVLKQFSDVNSIFKFVVDSLDDLHEISEIVESAGMPKERVYLMPKAKDELELQQNGSKVFEIAMNYGYAYSHRVHIQLFGSKRGI